MLVWLLSAHLAGASPSAVDWGAIETQTSHPPTRLPASSGWLSGDTAGPLRVGDRVRRGPDWRWRNQDGGPDGEGTVVVAGVIDGWARVAWDAGGANNYRWNVDGAFDLERFRDPERPMLRPEWSDEALLEEIRAVGASKADGWLDDLRALLVSAYDQDGSGAVDGDAELKAVPCPVWRAVEGQLTESELGLRAVAEASDAGDMARSSAHLVGFSADVHHLVAVRLPDCLQIPVVRSPRSMPTLHRDARVLRGPDWKWGKQGGGPDEVGVVVQAPTASDWVRVRWSSGARNTYRWGHDDAVDLVRVRSGRGVAQAMRAVTAPVGSGSYDAALLTIFLEAFDQDRSGFIEHPAEVRVVPCTVFQVLEDRFDAEHPMGEASALAAYGVVEGADWRGGVLGFSRGIRRALEQRWTSCAPEHHGLARAGQLPLGARVMRGPDWKWDDQDGGLGRVGTVVQAPTDQEWVRVAWDAAPENAYRWGHEGAHDLMLATAGAESGQLQRAIAASDWRGDPGGAARIIRPLIVDAYDFNQSETVDTVDELNAVSCDVMRAIEERYLRGGYYEAPFRAVYGFTERDRAAYVGAAIGLHPGLRVGASQRFKVCGVF